MEHGSGERSDRTMTSPELENLVRAGKLRREPPAAGEIASLRHSGEARLADAPSSVWRVLVRLAGIAMAPLVILLAAYCAWTAARQLLAGRWPWFLASVAGLATAWWLGSICWRLITLRPRPEGGLLSARVLRGAALFFLAVPVISLATGAWRQMNLPWPLFAFEAVLYLLIGRKLWRSAQSRSSAA